MQNTSIETTQGRDDTSSIGFFGRAVVLLFSLAVALVLPEPVLADGARLALVIGNSEYQAMPVLTNPGADADAVSDVLRKDGFSVELEKNLTLRGMREVFRSFGDRARGAEVALVYYAGHGMQMAQREEAENYLLPVDAKLADADDVNYQAVPLTRLLELLSDAQTRIVLLDACRDNPIVARLPGAGTRGLTRSGLAPVAESAARGSLIGFAAAPGQKAKDGNRNSPYATALVRVLGTPGLEIDLMLRRVADEVEEVTDGNQVPEHMNRLRGRDGVYLAGLVKPGPMSVAPTAPVPAIVPGPPQANLSPQEKPPMTPPAESVTPAVATAGPKPILPPTHTDDPAPPHLMSVATRPTSHADRPVAQQAGPNKPVISGKGLTATASTEHIAAPSHSSGVICIMPDGSTRTVGSASACYAVPGALPAR